MMKPHEIALAVLVAVCITLIMMNAGKNDPVTRALGISDAVVVK